MGALGRGRGGDVAAGPRRSSPPTCRCPPRRDDYTKTIQVGPNIQFIYRINVCANTVAKCQNQEAPATEVGFAGRPPTLSRPGLPSPGSPARGVTRRSQALKIPAGETCRVLGRLDGAQYKEALQPPSATNPSGAGVSITYSNGDICDPTAKCAARRAGRRRPRELTRASSLPASRTTRSVTLNVQCDEGEEGKITEVKKEGTCATTFNMVSKCAPFPALPRHSRPSTVSPPRRCFSHRHRH